MQNIIGNLKRIQSVYNETVKKLSLGKDNLISKIKRIESLEAKARKGCWKIYKKGKRSISFRINYEKE